MPPWVKGVWSVISFATTAWAIWGLVQIHFLRVGSKMIDDPHMLSGLYVFFGTLGIGGLFLLNRSWIEGWINRRRPSVQLHALGTDARVLAQEISHASDMAGLSGREVSIGGTMEARIRKICFVLDSIKVAYPQVENVIAWVEWLPRLIAWAETRDVKGARKYRIKQVGK